MKQLWIIFCALLLIGLLPSTSPAQELFARQTTIPVPAIESSGFGNLVAGVDIDNDGKPDLYAVNSNWNDTGSELIPRIYKFEYNGTTWDSVWSATLNVPMQNTWPALTVGDMDNDGKKELIWGPVNFLDATTNPKPGRIFVFESKGDGSDVMGISSGSNFLPNAQWRITDSSMYDLRPFKWVLSDVDADGKKEVIFCDRGAPAAPFKAYRFGVLSVSTIPDNGDGSETWSLEYSGKDSTLATGTIYDLAVLDSTIYLFHNVAAGTVTAVKHAAGTWSIQKGQTGLVPGGAWKSSQVVDLDGDGKKEIVVAGFTSPGANKVYLLQQSGDTLTSTVIADLASLIGSTGRLYGGAAGDIDNDGKLDFVFGSRDATPNAAIVRMKYLGGSITSPASYVSSIIDQEYSTAGGRWDMIAMANVDADPALEVFYGDGIGDPLLMPIVHLRRVVLGQAPVTIGEARKDLNADYLPDRAGDTVTVVGLINSVNYTASANRFSYYIQDATGGINITKGSQTGGGPVYKLGDKLAVRGKIEAFNGSVQLNILDSLSRWVTYLGSGFALTPIEVTLDTYLADPEKYEGRYLRVKNLGKAAGSPAWPAANADANYLVWDGFRTIVLRADRDTDLDGTVEPVSPFTIVGVSTQYSTATPPNDGYQVTVNAYADIIQNVAAPPNRHFSMVEPANNATVVLNDTAQIVTFRWRAAVDLNKDTLSYSWAPIGKAVVPSARDTFLTRTGKQMLTYLGSADSVVLRWTAIAKDPANPAVYSLDTLSVKVKRGTIVGVAEGDGLPVQFSLEQNFPNPFNPSTAIRFSLPVGSTVSLRVYDVLGREVATLAEGVLEAGIHTALWNGTSRTGAGIASGMYICRLEARPIDGSRAFVDMRKMMLVK